MGGELNARTEQVFWGEIAPPVHMAQFYNAESVLLDHLVGFIGGGLKGGESTIVIATDEHLAALEQGLVRSGVNISDARRKDRYISLLAEAALSTFMVNDWPDDRLFTEFVDGLIARARASASRVRAFGEMVAILWAQGHAGATVRLEYLWNQMCWNQVCNRQGFSLLCAYPKPGFTEDPTESLAKICAAHQRVV